MFAFRAGWVEVELCWEVALSFLFIADGTLSTHRFQVDTPGFLPFYAKFCCAVGI